MTTDLISNMLTRLRNASLAKHSSVLIPYTKLNGEILKAFQKDGYIKSFQVEMSSRQVKKIRIFLLYEGWLHKKPVFSVIKRISKPGQRIFCGYQDFPKKLSILKYHQGSAILSTSFGVMNHLKAQQLRVGGEILCYIE
jgi:small subunit ribosomal protein S8